MPLREPPAIKPTSERITPNIPRQSEKLFRMMADNLRDYGLFLLSPDGVVASWNPGAERVKGYRAEEIIGKHFSIFYTERDLAINKPQRHLDLATETGRCEDEGWRLRKDGSRFWANVVITAIRDEKGELLGFGKITRDLTERREADLRYKLLIEGITDYAIYFLDPKGFITSWNAGAQRIKGYSASEILGKHFSTFYTPEDAAANLPDAVLRKAAEAGHYEAEGWRVRKDGTKFWSSVVVTPIRDEEGTLVGFSKITRDITHRKELLDTIQRHAHELEQRVIEHEQTNAELEAFSYSVSHDLRSPLRAIEGFSDIITTDFGDQLPEEVKGYLGQISQATRRMNRLVQDLLDYSRLTRVELKPTEVEITSVVQDALQQVEQDRRGRVHFNVPKGLRAYVHPATLTQALYNLISNGLKFARPGTEPKVEVTACREGSRVKIAVRDEGIGIPPQHHERIFQVFEKLHAPSKYPGTGIGLAIVKRGIARMGGTVSLSSEPDKGSTFMIEVPAA